MMLEISKSYLRQEYAGNLKKCISEMDGILWNKERIKGAFNFGNGTEKDFHEYMRNNKQYCIFVRVQV